MPYALIPKNQRPKLDAKSKCYVFVGYGNAVKGYTLWDPSFHKIVISRDIAFDESSFLKSNVENFEQERVSLNQQTQLETQPFSESQKEEETYEEKGEEDVMETIEVQQPVTL